MAEGFNRDTEKRVYSRIGYPVNAAARLEVGGRRMTLTDLSQGGVRVAVPAGDPLAPTLHGTLFLLHGTEVPVEARCEWRQPEEAGLSFVRLLPADLIEKENQYVIVHFDC